MASKVFDKPVKGMTTKALARDMDTLSPAGSRVHVVAAEWHARWARTQRSLRHYRSQYDLGRR